MSGIGSVVSLTGGVNDAVLSGCATSLWGSWLAQVTSAVTDDEAAAGTLSEACGDVDGIPALEPPAPPPPPQAAKPKVQTDKPNALAKDRWFVFMFDSFVLVRGY
jgi:hypothetical protein